MIYTITAPAHIRSTIQLPASKSISNRILILNALSNSPYPVENLSDSDDTRVMSNAFETKSSLIDIGAAGTSMRFLTAYLSQIPGEYVITGTERMKNRPIRILTDALRRLGAEIEYMEKEGFPPLHINGKYLDGGSISLDGSVSSQYVSALMMIAPCMKEGLTLHLKGDIISRPYIEMTLRLMETFGIKTAWSDSTIYIHPQTFEAQPFRVESDWSAASYWYEIAALSESAPEIVLPGLSAGSVQGDSALPSLFERLGLTTRYDRQHTVVHVSGKGRAGERVSVFHSDLLYTPDLAQTMVVTCCLLQIPFRFSGLQSLRIKETDRIAALIAEMRKLGYVIEEENGHILEWTGKHCLPVSDPVIATYEDHRMAMAFAPACLKTGTIKISNPEVVSKSYPHFWDDLKQAGFTVEAE
jgi:3-phosphoshikimate 1-carboxyvinyltransferase